MYLPVCVGFSGYGYRGYSYYYPSEDIRGFKFGCGARNLLLSGLPVVDVPSSNRSDFACWLTIESPSQRKVAYRLRDVGLLWLCWFYEEGTTQKPKMMVALTPNGGDIMACFGDDMKKGQRIRWQKWTKPSIASNDERFRETLDRFNLGEDCTISLRENLKKKANLFHRHKSRGTSMEYLAARLVRYDNLWNGGFFLSVSNGTQWSSPALNPHMYVDRHGEELLDACRFFTFYRGSQHQSHP